MQILKDLKLPFYLSGGTALSRFYYHHRYSDDLDFFVNDDISFKKYIDKFLNYCRKEKQLTGLEVNVDRIFAGENYFQIFIRKDETDLKIDFINDIPIRFGELNSTGIIPLDNARNILSNKISALYRLEIKDFVDLWIISKNLTFNWREIIRESKEKEPSIDPLEIITLFKTFPFEKLNLIKWIIHFDLNQLKTDFDLIAEDVLNGSDNSLYKSK